MMVDEMQGELAYSVRLMLAKIRSRYFPEFHFDTATPIDWPSNHCFRSCICVVLPTLSGPSKLISRTFTSLSKEGRAVSLPYNTWCLPLECIKKGRNIGHNRLIGRNPNALQHRFHLLSKLALKTHIPPKVAIGCWSIGFLLLLPLMVGDASRPWKTFGRDRGAQTKLGEAT